MIIRWTLMVNLVDGDIERAQQIWNPVELDITSVSTSSGGGNLPGENCSSPGSNCDSSILVRMLPLIVVILFFLFLSNGSALLLRSVTTEKENRMMEILILSIDPRQMLTGKIIGLGIASFLQLLMWVGSFYFMLQNGGQTLNLPAEFSLPSNLLFWWIVFFLFGYVIYASLMAGAGTLVPSMKEITSASWVMMLPLLIGYFISVTPIGLESPHGPLVTALSLFPLTTPVVMIMRLTVGGVPPWQLYTAVGLSFVSALFIVNASARLFRAQTLLSGESFKARRFIKVLLQI
jgi:ABC-2 type transport system permease protein